MVRRSTSPAAGVAELADATDSKSVAPEGACRFDSCHRHHERDESLREDRFPQRLGRTRRVDRRAPIGPAPIRRLVRRSERVIEPCVIAALIKPIHRPEASGSTARRIRSEFSDSTTADRSVIDGGAACEVRPRAIDWPMLAVPSGVSRSRAQRPTQPRLGCRCEAMPRARFTPRATPPCSSGFPA